MNDFEYDLYNRATAYNMPALEAAVACGCFHCGRIFDPGEITDWMAEPDGPDTGVCPFCGTDALVPDTDETPVATYSLANLYTHWFKEEYDLALDGAT